MSPTPVVERVITVLGDSRPVTRTYGDGSVDCPYCVAAIIYPATECSNPACDSSKYWTPAALQERRDREAARLAEEARRKRDHAWAMQRAEEDRILHEQWRKDQVAEAIKRGACLLCLFLPGWDRVKFVKHRKPCPKRNRTPGGR
jgi:hypothetical protein